MENKISSWIGIGAAVVALVTSIFTFNIDRKMKVLEAQQKNLTYIKDSTDFTRDRDFKFKIYQLVVEAIDKKADDTLKQRAAIIVVSEMVDDKDAKFKLGLLNVIRNASRNKEIQNSSGDKIYALEETLKAKSIQSGADQWRVDVFYVEEKQKTAEPVASAVASLLKEAGYNTTVRLLPDAVNRRKGYGIKSSQIRYESNEKDEALRILKHVTEGASMNLEEKQTTSTTAKYISIFIFQ